MKHTRILLIAAIFSMMMLGLQSCFLSSAESKQLLSEKIPQTYDVIIVPGIAFQNHQWDRVMKARIYWSKYLYDHGITKNIIYSGSSVYTPYCEAKIMSLYAEAIGIPKEHIFLETRAEHSTENIYYSYKLAKKLGFEHIALASDPFQSKMLKRYARSYVSPDVAVIPVIFDTLKAMEPTMIDPVIDCSQAYDLNFVSITERQGFFKRFQGTMGKNIDTTLYN